MNRLTQILIGALAILLAIGAGLYGRSRYLQDVSTYLVPVPIHDLAPYTILTADQFQLREMPRSMESLPYSQSISDLEGKISTMPIPAGLPVPLQSAVPVDQFRLASSDFEVISIPVEPVSTVGGQVRIGERINLYRVVEESAEDSPSAKLTISGGEYSVETIAERLLVVDVRTSQGQAAETSRQASEESTFGSNTQTEQVQILTLAVLPDQVGAILETVAQSKNQGALLWTTLALP